MDRFWDKATFAVSEFHDIMSLDDIGKDPHLQNFIEVETQKQRFQVILIA